MRLQRALDGRPDGYPGAGEEIATAFPNAQKQANGEMFDRFLHPPVQLFGSGKAAEKNMVGNPFPFDGQPAARGKMSQENIPGDLPDDELFPAPFGNPPPGHFVDLEFNALKPP
jgi:hypothetical protein